jgi:hypothetical protein
MEYNNTVLKTETSSTGGTIERFSWGLRHTSGDSYGGENSKFIVKDNKYNPIFPVSITKDSE